MDRDGTVAGLLSKSVDFRYPPVMGSAWRTSRSRRFGLLGLLVVSLGLVGTVVWVLGTDDPLLQPEDVFPEPVIVPADKAPRFVFSDEVRTYDLSLNRFVDRFLRVCSEAKYSEFRLMLSRRSGDPVLAQRFEKMFIVLKEARIESVKRLPDVPEVQGPVYLLTATYDLEDHALKAKKTGHVVRLAISREEGEWRIGPIPADALARLRAYEQATSQPAVKEEAAALDDEPTKTPVSDAPKAAANRPARLDS